MHKFLHMLVSDAIFFKTSMKIRFRGSVQQQNPRKLVLNDYQWNYTICLLRKWQQYLCRCCSGTSLYTHLWRHYQSFFVPIADDKSVTSDEFLLDWMERHLGSSLEAVILFHHLDVDRNGHIEDTDIPWILAFFDRNSTILKTSSCQLQLTALL